MSRQDHTLWKDGQTTAQIAERVLRGYLVRCHRTIAQDFPEIADMDPANAADYLLYLRKTNRIRVELRVAPNGVIHCKVTDMAAFGGDCEPADGTART